MQNEFNANSRAGAARVLKDWGIDLTVQADGSILIEGQEAFENLASPRQTADGRGRTSLSVLMSDLARRCHGGEGNLFTIQMAEYRDEMDLNKLFGAPPGFMGSEQGGALTNELRKNPFCILFLDEVEKGHPELLRVLDEGIANGALQDNKGETAKFDNVIVVKFSERVSEPTRARREKARMQELMKAVKEATVLKQDVRPLKRFQLRMPAALA